MRNLSIPPVIAVDPHTVQVENTPICFVWAGRTKDNSGGVDQRRGSVVRCDNHQILDAIKPPQGQQGFEIPACRCQEFARVETDDQYFFSSARTSDGKISHRPHR